MVEAAARLVGVAPTAVLDDAELAALQGKASPEGVLVPATGAAA